MYSKMSLMALLAAAAVNEVTAGHVHQEKREIVWAATETVVITDYVTVTVTAGAALPTGKKHRPGHGHSKHKSKHHSSSSSSTTTSIPVAVPEPSTPVVTPTVHPTTMVTTVKTTTPAPIPTTTKTTTTSTVEQPNVPVPVPTTNPAPEPPVIGGGGSPKRGIAYNDADLVREFISLGGKASWAYNWGSSTPDLPEGLTYYPMLWSPAPLHSNGWDQFAEDAISNGADALLSFNEPDHHEQANMTPQDAAAGHKQWMNPYAGRVRISSPGITSSTEPNMGIEWLTQFFNACGGQCQVDFCAAHWYGPGGEEGATLFLDHLKNVHVACDNKPIWVTEFAALDGDIDGFMSSIVSALESDEFAFVEKYSYFMARVGVLFNSPTELSSYGRIFAGLT